jgi:hypothetical protein
MGDDRIIVKVQLSLYTTEVERQVVVYNEDQSIFFEMDAPLDVLELMGERPKAFFYATLKDGTLGLDEQAPWQNW